MQKIFFISDTHFSHIGAMKYHPERAAAAGVTMEDVDAEMATREYGVATAKHDEWLINLWNSTIGRNDIVYILGDFCWGNRDQAERILRRLHGKKYLILGNHDQACMSLGNYFQWMGSIKEAKFKGDIYPFLNGETFCIEMCHYPLSSWNRKNHGSVHACGHVHGAHDKRNEESGELIVDVGLDAALSGYQFITLEKLYNHFLQKRRAAGCATFKEYADKQSEKRGYRD